MFKKKILSKEQLIIMGYKNDFVNWITLPKSDLCYSNKKDEIYQLYEAYLAGQKTINDKKG